MHYVKQFNINGVDTKQVACIELHGKPNAATEGYVGVLGIDMDSPVHDVYKCVAVNGGAYTWELLSSGMSIMSSTINAGGETTVEFSYTTLRTPAMYVVKVGDLILDTEGYLYSISSLNSTYCVATYTGTQIAKYGKSAYDLAVQYGFEGDEEEWIASLKGDKGDTGAKGDKGDRGDTPYIGSNNNWWISGVDTGVLAMPSSRIVRGTYVGTGVAETYAISLTFDFRPKFVWVTPGDVYTGTDATPMGNSLFIGQSKSISFFTKSNGAVFVKFMACINGSDGVVKFGSLTSADEGYNILDRTYEYIAIG